MQLIPTDRTHHMALTMPSGLDCLVKLMPIGETDIELMVLITSGDRLGTADYRWKTGTGTGVQFYDAEDQILDAGPDHELNEAILVGLRQSTGSMNEADWWSNAYAVGFGVQQTHDLAA